MRLITEILTFDPKAEVRIWGSLSYLARVIRDGVVFTLSDFQQESERFEHPLRIASRRHDLIPSSYVMNWKRNFQRLAWSSWKI